LGARAFNILKYFTDGAYFWPIK